MKEFIRDWGAFLLKRFGSLLITLFAISLITFVIVRQAGTPVYLLLGQEFTSEMVESLNYQLGLDLPIYTQYANYLGGDIAR